MWFDAPIGYVSITANYSPEHWRKWWYNPKGTSPRPPRGHALPARRRRGGGRVLRPPDVVCCLPPAPTAARPAADVALYQFMGKDNIPFHTVIFPASLLGTGQEWTMLHHVSTTGELRCTRVGRPVACGAPGAASAPASPRAHPAGCPLSAPHSSVQSTSSTSLASFQSRGAWGCSVTARVTRGSPAKCGASTCCPTGEARRRAGSGTAAKSLPLRA